ncbi:hypothetical protein BDQ17DRAFT_674634 [Cyathus striatus]|nr:hypothetical protein BDQ17DRAFT_674634 [Cyathus striatus]
MFPISSRGIRIIHDNYIWPTKANHVYVFDRDQTNKSNWQRIAIVTEFEGTYICIKNIANKLVVSPFWLIVIIFETILFSLTIWKLASNVRLLWGTRRVSLGRLIVVDGTIYYIM